MIARGLIVDSFAGGGGASTGIEAALGRIVDLAINHDREALAMHAANHPGTRHFCEDVWAVDPRKACAGRPVELAWFSPDCKHFSKAKGGKPVEKRIRGLAWVAVKWAKLVRPRVIILENVEEFAHWGPLQDDGRPCQMRKGLTFRRFVGNLRNLGYAIDWQELVAADYGAPTTRRRLFLIARCDGLPIVWPEPTHDRWSRGGLPRWRAAAECIDWSIPCPSIFERKRPLADATLRRIARGVMRYVLNTAEPFIVPVAHQGDSRTHSINDPIPTVTGSQRGHHAIVTPFVARIGQTGGNGAYANDAGDPLTTVTSKAEHLLVAPFLVQRYGEREGQAPRSISVESPMPTIVPTENHGHLVAAFLAKHYGGHETPGSPASSPVDTVTATDHHALVASHLVKLRGTSRDGQPVDVPLHTISAQGTHFAEVRAFLLKYYGTRATGCELGKPLHTITGNDRFALVTVRGEEYAIVDIGMRMLTPRELFLAQGFPSDYRIELEFDGKRLTKTAQVRMCGNSVCPPLVEALVRANMGDVEREIAA